MEALNIYKMSNQGSIHPIFTKVHIIKKYRGLIIGSIGTGSQVVVDQGVIINERVKCRELQIDNYLDTEDYHDSKRPKQALKAGLKVLRGIK